MIIDHINQAGCSTEQSHRSRNVRNELGKQPILQKSLNSLAMTLIVVFRLL